MLGFVRPTETAAITNFWK